MVSNTIDFLSFLLKSNSSHGTFHIRQYYLFLVAALVGCAANAHQTIGWGNTQYAYVDVLGETFEVNLIKSTTNLIMGYYWRNA